MAASHREASLNGDYSAELERIKPCLMRSNGFFLTAQRCFTQRGLIRDGLTSLCEAPLHFEIAFIINILNNAFTFQ